MDLPMQTRISSPFFPHVKLRRIATIPVTSVFASPQLDINGFRFFPLTVRDIFLPSVQTRWRVSRLRSFNPLAIAA